jgi:hypothetical protein
VIEAGNEEIPNHFHFTILDKIHIYRKAKDEEIGKL